MTNYQFSNNTFIKTSKDDPRDRLTLEIGDPKKADFFPHLLLRRWDETAAAVSLDQWEPTRDVRQDKGKVLWVADSISASFYEHPVSGENPEGGCEFEIVLNGPPPGGKLTFSVDDSQTEWFHQPALNKEDWSHDKRVVEVTETNALDADGRVIAHRPEWAVNGFAVYRKEPFVNYAGQTLYRCGQVGFYKRHKATDAVGNWVWLEAELKNKKLVISLPEKFLAEAVWPVTVGPNFGYETRPLSYTSSISNIILGSVFACPESGTVDSITAYVGISTSTHNMKWGLYRHSDLGFVAATNQYSGTVDPPADKTLTYASPPAVTAQDYILVAWCSSATGTENLYYNTGLANQGHSHSATYGTFPDPMVPTHSTNCYGIYATYTAGGTPYTKTLTDGVSIASGTGITAGKNIAESFSMTSIALQAVHDLILPYKSFEGLVVASNAKHRAFEGWVLADYTVAMSDTFVVADTLSKKTGIAIANAITILDSVNKTMRLSKTESMTLVDAFIKNIKKAANESFDITESINKAAAKALTDTLAVTDILDAQLLGALTKALTDSVAATDSLAKRSAISFSDTLSIIETIVKNIGKCPVDAITIIETAFNASLSGNIAHTAELIDSLVISDSFASSANYARTFTEIFAIAESISLTMGLALSLADSLAVLDVMVKAVGVTVDDDLTITSNMTRTTAFVRSLIEVMNIIDSTSITGSGMQLQDFLKLAKRSPKKFKNEMEGFLSGRIGRFTPKNR